MKKITLAIALVLTSLALCSCGAGQEAHDHGSKTVAGDPCASASSPSCSSAKLLKVKAKKYKQMVADNSANFCVPTRS